MQTKNTTEASFQDLALKIKTLISYVKDKKSSLFVIALIGGLTGFFIAFFTPRVYVAKRTFVVEEGGSLSGGLSMLAGQFGFDLGGSGNSFFSGENILLFLKSEQLCRETFLTPYDEKGEITLADKFADVYGYKTKWRNKKSIGEINFSKYNNASLPRIPDSLLQILIRKKMLLEGLSVSKPDKKATFIQVFVSTRDEKVSQLFAERLVEIAIRKYVESKTKLKLANVNILQKRADSLGSILNSKTYSAASSQQKLVDINPALRSANVSTEITTREKAMVSTIFAEVIKNLEIAKFALSQEAPSIQMVDKSTLPLEVIKKSKLKLSIIWGLFFSIFYLIILFLKKMFS